MELKVVHPKLDREYAEEAFRFLTQNPVKPVYSVQQIERFITRMVSSDKNVIEVWAGNEKIIAGLLIDLVTNPHESSHIEFLGIGKNKKISLEHLKLLFQNLEKQVLDRKIHKGVVVGYHDSLPFPEEFLTELGYRFFYQMYELQLKEFSSDVMESVGSYAIHKLEMDSFEEYYEVLKQSFSENPDTSVGTRDDMKAGVLKAKIPTYAVRESGKIIGFINMQLNEETKIGEINTIGVLAEWRGKGVGKNLLKFALKHLKNLGAETINLSVAVANKNALQLYLRTGFEIQEENSAFRKEFARH